MQPPTVEEVVAHVIEKNYSFDPHAFVAFYESKGWKVGSSPMKNWKAACVTWARRDRRPDDYPSRERVCVFNRLMTGLGAERYKEEFLRFFGVPVHEEKL